MGEPNANRGCLWSFWYAIMSCFGAERADAGEQVSLLPSAAEKKIEEEVVVLARPVGVVPEPPYEDVSVSAADTRDFADRRVIHASRHPTRPVQGNQIPTAGGTQTRAIRGR